MVLPIQTARHAHAVRTPEQLAALQELALKRAAERVGDRPRKPWKASRPLVAYVSVGIWCGDCDCGSGVAVEPRWSAARCFACGAVYEHIELPSEDERLNIEHVLARRPRANQHWRPQDGEGLLQLAIENAAHGVRF